MPDRGSVTETGSLWDPTPTVAQDGLYFTLPRAGALVRVTPDGWTQVDLEAARPERLLPFPDGSGLLAFATYPTCELDDARIETVSECERKEGEVVWERELVTVRDGAKAGALALDGAQNAVAFSNDGQTAVIYFDYAVNPDVELSGLGNLTQVLFVDLASGEGSPVDVGFSAEQVLFTDDDSQAVVLSRSEVVLVDVPGRAVLARFPLSLDPDAELRPEEVELTPDGQYALIRIAGRSELYVIDLLGESINIVSLTAVPSDMVIDPSTNQAVLVYGSSANVDLLDLENFEVERLALEEVSTRVLATADRVLLYNDVGGHDLYSLDPVVPDIEEMRVENPISTLVLHPEGLAAVAVERPESWGSSGGDLQALYDANWCVEVIDVTRAEGTPFLAAAEPVGLAFAGTSALVLLDGAEELLLLDLPTLVQGSVELESPAQSLGSFGELFWIAHENDLGLISFMAEDGTLSAVGGFGTVDLLLDETPLRVEAQ